MGPRPRTPATRANAVQKVCAVLRVLAARAPARLTDIARGAGISKVTALRILDTLVAERFVERAAVGKAYALGVETTAMAARALGPAGILARLAQPALLRLAADSGDTALLAVRSGAEAVYIGRETGDFPVQPNVLQVGSRRPLGVGAAGLALLAWLPDAEIDAVLQVVAPRLAELPSLSEPAVRAKIAEARDQGYTVLVDTSYYGMGGVGVPIRGGSGQILGALSIAALSERIRSREQALAAMLRREVEQLMATLTPETGGRAVATQGAGRAVG